MVAIPWWLVEVTPHICPFRSCIVVVVVGVGMMVRWLGMSVISLLSPHPMLVSLDVLCSSMYVLVVQAPCWHDSWCGHMFPSHSWSHSWQYVVLVRGILVFVDVSPLGSGWAVFPWMCVFSIVSIMPSMVSSTIVLVDVVERANWVFLDVVMELCVAS